MNYEQYLLSLLIDKHDSGQQVSFPNYIDNEDENDSPSPDLSQDLELAKLKQDYELKTVKLQEYELKISQLQDELNKQNEKIKNISKYEPIWKDNAEDSLCEVTFIKNFLMKYTQNTPGIHLKCGEFTNQVKKECKHLNLSKHQIRKIMTKYLGFKVHDSNGYPVYENLSWKIPKVSLTSNFSPITSPDSSPISPTMSPAPRMINSKQK